jgi:hypothetical protein
VSPRPHTHLTLNYFLRSYDHDVQPKNRRLYPKVVGYIPDKSRGLVLGVMMAISAFTMTSQVFSLVLLYTISGTALALYLAIPMSLHVPQHHKANTKTH